MTVNESVTQTGSPSVFSAKHVRMRRYKGKPESLTRDEGHGDRNAVNQQYWHRNETGMVTTKPRSPQN